MAKKQPAVEAQAISPAVDGRKTIKKLGGRVFREQMETLHDLYKLRVTTFKKNIGWEDGGKFLSQDLVDVEHCHFFHSVDSDGVPQEHSTPTGGHFHIMELVKPATDDSPAEYRCSAPKKWAYFMDRSTRSESKKIVDFAKYDSHSHEMDYLHSEKVHARKINPEFSKLVVEKLAEPALVEGISG